MIKVILSFPVLVLQKIAQNISRFIAKILSDSKNPILSNVLSMKSSVNAAIVASLVYAIYFLLQPFGVENYTLENKNLLIGLSAAAGLFGYVTADFLFPAIFRAYFKPENWNIRKEISLYALRFFFIGLGVMVFGNQTGLTNFNLPIFLLQFTAVGTAIGLVSSFMREKTLKKRFHGKATELNKRIQSIDVEQNGKNTFPVLAFKGSNDKISIVPNQLVSAKITKYKTEFIYQNLFGTVNKTLDISRKDVIKELEAYDHQFKQLGKRHYINAQAIYKVKGNGAGYMVHVAKMDSPLNIVRNFNKRLENI